ncbi:MAG: DUF4167 domain-containing protein [Pseudomonadota bacterium]
MRQGQQNRRNRGRNNGRKVQQNSSGRNHESNGPDVKIRGTASHIAEKYATLARDALSSGDTISSENLFQHAEHYNRIVMSLQSSQANQAQDVQAVSENGPSDIQNGNGNAMSNGEIEQDAGDDKIHQANGEAGKDKSQRSPRGMNGRRRSRKRSNGHANANGNGHGNWSAEHSKNSSSSGHNNNDDTGAVKNKSTNKRSHRTEKSSKKDAQSNVSSGNGMSPPQDGAVV